MQAAKAMTAQKPLAVSPTLAALRADPFPCWFGFVMLALSEWVDVAPKINENRSGPRYPIVGSI
jgi:hypothetical protein